MNANGRSSKPCRTVLRKALDDAPAWSERLAAIDPDSP